MRCAEFRHQARPIRFAEDEIIDAAKHKASRAMGYFYRFVLERHDADGLQTYANFFRIAAKVVVIAEAEPGAARSA
jgi:hypothetical protein